MKKLVFFLTFVLAICCAMGALVFAKYDHSSFPTASYSFSSTQSYTYYRSLNNEPVYDGTYTKGSKFLGIVTKKTGNALSVKAVPYYYNYCIVTVRSGSEYGYQDSGTPTQVGVETNISTVINTAAAADSMRYDFRIYQLNGYDLINVRDYDYYVYNNSSGQQFIEIEGD